MTTAITRLTELSGDYALDVDHSRIGFVARHAMVTKVRGQFDAFEGGVTIDGEDFSRSTARVTIQVASIDTRNGQRDAHLREGDFLAAERFPEITFVSTAVALVDEQTLNLTGDLTIKGVTRSVTVPFEYQGAVLDPFGNHRVGFEGSTVIDRKDYDITWNAALETGGVLIGDKVTLEFELAVTRPAA